MTEKFNIPQAFNGVIVKNKELSSFTSFKIGGSTPLLLEPSSIQDMILLLGSFHEQNCPFFILGGGSNLVIADEGIPVPVMTTGALNSIHLSETDTDTVLLTCGSGLSFKDLLEYCIDNSLAGLENFAGLPGTAGGAVYMNARCYEKSISDVLSSVSYLHEADKYNTEKLYVFCKDDWAYKVSPFQNTTSIITQAVFRVKRGNKDSIAEKCTYFTTDRDLKKHFSFPSAGSVFKNNHAFGKPSGQIIDEAGLKGLRIGGAQIAPWHGNFIINIDHAKASDVKSLVCVVQDTVFKKFGFNLEPEIIFTQDLF